MIPLEPEKYYHIYNRANGNEILFANEGNYPFFLQKYKKYIEPIADTFSYCLMPNHFHLLLRIKNLEDLRELETFPKFQTLEKFLSKQFARLFSAYTQAFNKQQNRKGSLFMKNFKRKLVNDDKYLLKLLHYIHLNPVTHGFCLDPEEWSYSSYKAIVSGKQTLVKKEEVIEWFGDMDNFIYCHTHASGLTGINDF